MASIPKRVTQEEYIFGDFDRDGTKNIDDTRPFDKRKSKPPYTKKYWLKSHYSGGEVLLSDELRAYKKHADSYRKPIVRFMMRNPGTTGRVKTVPSLMRKLRENHGHSIGDTGGMRLLTADRKEAYMLDRKIARKYRTVRGSRDDFYKKPKGGVYYGLHRNIFLMGRSIELQIKSSRMQALSDRTHKAYKYHKPMKKYRKEGRRLFRLGY